MGKKPVFLGLFLFLLASPLAARVELPPLLGDGAVIQRGEPVVVWGWSEPGAEVTVRFAGEARTVHGDGRGAWRAEFAAREAGGPHALEISSGAETLSVRDILVGDVWLCSGQSNMEWVLRNAEGAAEDIAASENMNIRHFLVPHSWAALPSDRLAGGSWKAAHPASAGDFTAIGYYFARRIQAETGVPIGLLHSSWGGANIESWMSPEALGESPEESHARIGRLEAEAEKRAAALREKFRRWPGAVTDRVEAAAADWSAAILDESGWMELSAPMLWESQGFDGVDGVVWYRKKFSLDARQASGGVRLHLARIDDSDTTWVNGHRVGATERYDQVRSYAVPAEFLQPGDNVIAVRVTDTGGGGGIYSDAGLLYVEAPDGAKIPLAGKWKARPDRVTIPAEINANHTPSALYNKMIHPLIPFPVRGVLWYQGESNADDAGEAVRYREQFKNFITGLRRLWRRPGLAFYWVQLANWISGGDTPDSSPWALLREAQTAALELPNTGQAVTIDIGDPRDIHPKDKKTVGTRLALIALHKTYGKTDVGYVGPLPEKATSEGAAVRIGFSSAAPAPAARGGAPLLGFELAGKDGKHAPADARIEGRTVVVTSPAVPRPVSVRYAWKDNPEDANLAGDNGLPAGPFRMTLTD